MAHKHNRRRVRPRNRNHTSLHPILEMPDELLAPSDSSALFLPSASPDPEQSILPQRPRATNPSVASRHWYNRYVAWQNRDKAQRREAAKIEAEQIKLFGGYPGDDVGLCYKMMEVFAGMNWIDTLD
ncbi:uncharacterized protein Z520_09442 [Fonsecaea multimorphosa CBS 102226]|uniref:Uncharacterized protein n=1 Tax=Fonsecaea multimorphosa CBS 102226 TaxID=1442371 RepID=A0A0D2JN24_9EURO|nr:uncharacterized protein Z520_09442 [Fonsecaea multimorphosa CBS 102226]KIX94752.1 hypothetical protein Z520_09442 [Fonsecaea multimorphosa CBS 102226]OAL20527.1 hypothetical protein AYO22_08828 [Fonsecaea multimorphosa]